MHYPKVVLVTGACRFLGGYLTARLAQNPLINHVIAVDAIAPSKDLLRRMGRAEFVRADIRNPFIAKVIRNGDVDTVVHAAAASYAPRSGGRAALKELNVMGAIQLFAACQKAPSVRRVDPQVDVRGVRLQRARSGAVHRGQQRAAGRRARASPATASTSRATRAAWAGAGPTSRSPSCGWPT